MRALWISFGMALLGCTQFGTAVPGDASEAAVDAGLDPRAPSEAAVDAGLDARAPSEDARADVPVPKDFFIAKRDVSEAQIDLTALGKSDWKYRGRKTVVDFDNKSSVGSLIEVADVQTGTVASWGPGLPTKFSWTDGTPSTNASDVDGHIFINKVSQGFKFKVAAKPTGGATVLHLFVTANHVRGTVRVQRPNGAPLEETVDSTSLSPKMVDVAIHYSLSLPTDRLEISWTLGFLYGPNLPNDLGFAAAYIE
jgi:hypothetical protein